MGLSFLVPGDMHALTVTVRWGDYTQAELPEADGGPLSVWQREPREARVEVALRGGGEQTVHNVPGSGGPSETKRFRYCTNKSHPFG